MRTTRLLLRAALVPLILAGLAACGDHPRDVGAPAAHQLPLDSVILTPGRVVTAGPVTLALLGVRDDSRCPIDVVCVWQGNAAVTLAIGRPERSRDTAVLNTAEGLPSVTYGGARVTLIGLEPAPLAEVAIPPEAYRAIVRVEAVD